MPVERLNKYFLLAIPLLISLGIIVLFYPGFMSFDTFYALHGARNGVTESIWPPMVSYVWRVVDLFSSDPSAMHFSQVFLLMSSIFYIVFFFTKKIYLATIFLLIYLSIPVILGTIAVIWKDVLMAAFLLSGFAVIIHMRHIANRWWFIFLSLLALFLLFLGVCSRHNAIAGAFPLLLYFAFVVSLRRFNRPYIFWLSVVLLGSVLTGSVFAMKTMLDNYSIPGFNKLNNTTSDFIQTVRVLDVAGASVCVGNNLFGEMAPNLSVSEIRSLYDPRHQNLSLGLINKISVDNRIDKIWLNTAIHHPICFWNNKFQLTKYMIGANKGEQFLITHTEVDENEYGYTLPKSLLRDLVATYILNDSKLPFFRPWFIYLISIIVFIYMAWNRKFNAAYLAIVLSAFFYFASLVLMGNTADARLSFYTTTTLLIFIFISIFEFRKRYKLS